MRRFLCGDLGEGLDETDGFFQAGGGFDEVSELGEGGELGSLLLYCFERFRWRGSFLDHFDGLYTYVDVGECYSAG